MKKTNKYNIICIVLSVVLFMFSSYVISSIYNKGGYDYGWHLNSAKEITIAGFIQYYISNTYPLWHLLSKIGTKILPFSDGVIVGIVTSAFTVIAFVMVCKWLLKECKEAKTPILVIILSLFMFVLGPLYVPQFNTYYYLGQGTPNVWHNPTNLTVRPLAILAFIIIVKIIRDYKNEMNVQRRDYIILALTLVVSVFAKPSCIIMIIPGLGLYMIITFVKDRSLFKLYLKLVLAFVPAVLIFFSQYLIIFASGQRGDNVGFSWLTVWNFYTPNVFISFLLAMAFPIVVFLTDYKESFKDPTVHLAICCLISGWLESAILVEDGQYLKSGNFLWGYYLAMCLVWMVALKRFLLMNRKKEVSMLVSSVLLVLHIVCGSIYIYQLVWIPGITC